jgi:hypothetical protein
VRARIVLALSLVAVLGGCGSSSKAPSPATGDYVGKIPGGTASVAVVVGRANVVAYVCDWRHGVAELFTGSRSGDRLTLHGRRGSELTATVAGKRVDGSFTATGKAHRVAFGATATKPPSGFYRARGRVRGKRATFGWVVLPDGEQRGAATVGSTVVAAPALNTSTSTATVAGGGSVSAIRISSGTLSRAGFSGGGFSGFGG